MTNTPTSARRVRRRLAAAGGTVALTALALTAGTANAAPAGSAEVVGDTLTVNAGSGADRLALRLQAGSPGTLQVDFGDDGSAEQSFDRSSFARIDVFLGSGADQFRVDQANGAFADEALSVDGGSGDDVINGGDAAETLSGGSGNDAIDGNRGDDTGLLGSGSDSFRWDPGDGSDVVEGASGTDTLDFNGAGANEIMSLSPNGERSLFLRDVANIRMDMDNVEQLDLTALGGTDRVTIDDMTGTDFRRAAVDLSGPAGGGDLLADVVTVNGSAAGDQIGVSTDGSVVEVTGLQVTTTISGAETIDLLQVNGGAGDDTIDVDDDVDEVIGVNVAS
ncbi:MAG: calcium-binding protein [Ilumatobacteraceae bacterium]